MPAILVGTPTGQGGAMGDHPVDCGGSGDRIHRHDSISGMQFSQ